jgi:hypothetical protein
MKLTYEAQIAKRKEGEGFRFSIFANWDESLNATAETLVEAQTKFTEMLLERGISKDAVTFKMNLG